MERRAMSRYTLQSHGTVTSSLQDRLLPVNIFMISRHSHNAFENVSSQFSETRQGDFKIFIFALIDHSIRFNGNRADSDKQNALATCIGLMLRRRRLRLHSWSWECCSLRLQRCPQELKHPFPLRTLQQECRMRS